jgi:hypothetical protein
VLRIRLGFSADPDPAFLVNSDLDTDQDPGFWWTQTGKKSIKYKHFHGLYKQCLFLHTHSFYKHFHNLHNNLKARSGLASANPDNESAVEAVLLMTVRVLVKAVRVGEFC